VVELGWDLRDSTHAETFLVSLSVLRCDVVRVFASATHFAKKGIHLVLYSCQNRGAFRVHLNSVHMNRVNLGSILGSIHGHSRWVHSVVHSGSIQDDPRWPIKEELGAERKTPPPPPRQLSPPRPMILGEPRSLRVAVHWQPRASCTLQFDPDLGPSNFRRGFALVSADVLCLFLRRFCLRGSMHPPSPNPCLSTVQGRYIRVTRHPCFGKVSLPIEHPLRTRPSIRVPGLRSATQHWRYSHAERGSQCTPSPINDFRTIIFMTWFHMTSGPGLPHVKGYTVGPISTKTCAL
jgi:hypothetical protein